jgi:preprotein translocase subunit YajC
VSIGILLPLILIIGVMFMMTRSQKTKQRQASEMRNKMEPGTGVRTIGGMYAVVKEVNEETVLLEITDGVHAHFAKSAIGTVLSEDEFNRIVHGIEPEGLDDEGEQDTEGADDSAAGDAAAGTSEPADGSDERVDLGKSDQAAEPDDSAAEDDSEDAVTKEAVTHTAKERNGSAAK